MKETDRPNQDQGKPKRRQSVERVAETMRQRGWTIEKESDEFGVLASMPARRTKSSKQITEEWLKVDNE